MTIRTLTPTTRPGYLVAYDPRFRVLAEAGDLVSLLYPEMRGWSARKLARCAAWSHTANVENWQTVRRSYAWGMDKRGEWQEVTVFESVA